MAVLYDHLDRSIMHRDDPDNRDNVILKYSRRMFSPRNSPYMSLQKKTNYSMTLEWAREYLEQLRNIQEQSEARRKKWFQVGLKIIQIQVVCSVFGS